MFSGSDLIHVFLAQLRLSASLLYLCSHLLLVISDLFPTRKNSYPGNFLGVPNFKTAFKFVTH